MLPTTAHIGSREQKSVNHKIILEDVNCYYTERKFIKCMKNSKDDLKACVDLLNTWNTCMDKYYNAN